MRIALAQINTTLGGFKANAEKILAWTKRAKDKRADLVIFPELSLFGYPPNDALELPHLVDQQTRILTQLLKELPKSITVIFGAITNNPLAPKGGKPYSNTAVVARRGEKTIFISKQLLPSYDVFDETRFFEPGQSTGIVKIPGVGRAAISICEDMWFETELAGNPIYKKNILAGLSKVDLVVNISASPFSKDKMKHRLATAVQHVKKNKTPFIYVNQVGGQDELVFDGRSFILDQNGKLVVQAIEAEEDLVMTDLGKKRSEYRPNEEDSMELLRKVLVLGIRDFVKKTGQSSVHLGLSGGIDSALVAALAVDALGPSRVAGLLLPGPYSSDGSVTDSLHLAKNLGIKTTQINITSLFKEAEAVSELFPQVDSKTLSLTEQNLQARLRGLILMAYSNREKSMLLSTSNKCELAVGYSTLYGDTCGGLMPIGDLTKGEVYALARHYNSAREVIPQAILEKLPSAELAPNQVDQDTLPPYDILDRAVVNLVEKQKAPSTKVEKWLAKKLKLSEFKRWQAPPILHISEHSFGRGRRLPIARD